MRRYFSSYFMGLFLIAGCIPSAVRAQCGQCQYMASLVVNGTFSSGNSGFTSDYNLGTGFFCPLCNENTYGVGASAIFFHSDFWGFDHTNPPTGNFMVVNGSAAAGTHVWCQTMGVQPNTDYTFSFWGQDVTNNSDPHPHALLAILFNGVQFGATEEIEGAWEEVTTTWNSGSLTSVEICITNLQDQTGGNDFGIDDLSFTGCQSYFLTNQVFAGIDQDVCNGNSMQLGEPPIPGYTYSWSGGSGLNNMSIANPVYTAINTGSLPFTEQFILTLDSAGVGCTQLDTITLTVYPMPDFDLGPDQITCPDDILSLDAGTGWQSILWNNGSSLQTMNIFSSGTYGCTVGIDQCSTYDEVVVTEVDLPGIDLGPDLSICEDEAAILFSGYVGEWSNGTTGVSTQVENAGEYYFTYTAQGCTVTDSIGVDVDFYPVLNLPADTFLCAGLSIVLDAGLPVQWNPGGSGNAITVNTPGQYAYVATAGSCTLSGTVVVDQIELPAVDLPVNATGCEGEAIILSAWMPQNTSYSWNTGDTNDTLKVMEAGTYSVAVGNVCGIASDSTLVFFDLCGWDVFVPNTFTPNGDGKNDAWSIQGFNVSTVAITVYNRLGVPVWEGRQLGDAWEPDEFTVGDDAYNFLITGTNVFGEDFRFTGHVLLLK